MEADLIFTGGQVVTVDARDRVVEALATRGNRILAVGSRSEVEAYRGPKTRVVDLNGRALVPGLIDAHAHVTLYGMYARGVDCRYPAVQSISDIQARIAEAARRTPPGQWIRGWAYNQKKLRESRHPTRHDLDAVAPDHPVMLVRTDYHISVVNSRALQLAGITRDTPDPKGGRIERDASGEPTGVLVDAAHMQMMKVAMPSVEELRQAILDGCRGFASLGITCVHDAGGFGPLQYQAMAEAAIRGELPIRLYAMVWSMVDVDEMLEHFLETGLPTGFGNPWLRLGPLKLMTDGSSSGPTAAVREPYTSNPHDRGILYYAQEEINSIFEKAHRRGFQLTAHAVGDRAVEMVVSAIESAAGPDAPRRRPRIEHCGIVDESLLERIQRAGIVPIPQPIFCYDFGDGYLRDYGERTEYMFACRSFLERGIPAAASSDAPVTSADPMLGIWAAVTRRTQGGAVIGARQAVTVRQALRMYTWNAAYAEFSESEKGSLEPGKLADLTVLSDPILDVGVDSIKGIRAVMTVVGGKVVYEAG